MSTKLGDQVAREAQVFTISHHYISGSVSDRNRQLSDSDWANVFAFIAE